jgi:hypothetical protein
MRVYVHEEGRVDADAVDLDEAIPIGDALEIASDDVAVFVEDADEELDPTATLAVAGVADRAHLFRGRRRRIKVAVSFNGESIDREFRPNATVGRVFRWATGPNGFDLSKEDAAEHTLAISPGDTIPPRDAHLGSLDNGSPGRLTFALIPKHRFEG